ncbi:MAG TPA: gamma-glutamylcyclotransferase family protein [Sporichthya sp.]|jgi:gamma-glutamylcyclotransferase (GGCT)/AIG2-like uncharacterized protein YtfP|nr:gamma-glutamylcyclotransferase family protein [Sporichthya sp.]
MILEPAPHHQGIMPFFVYGSLMTGFGNATIWNDRIDRIEQNLIVTGYQLFGLEAPGTAAPYPYAVPDPDPDHFIMGELLWPSCDIDAGQVTKDFDWVEGHPQHYLRQEVAVLRGRDRTVKAWMYVFPSDRHLIPRLTPLGSSWRVYRDQCQRQGKRLPALLSVV